VFSWELISNLAASELILLIARTRLGLSPYPKLIVGKRHCRVLYIIPVLLESRWQGVPYHLSYKTVLATFTAHGS
jgi:hypothetical protein